MTVSYPRLAARTLRFTLGIPRNLTIAPDGSAVRFIRTPDGVTRSGQLWQFDVASGTETLLVDPAELLGGHGEELSAQERARRERSRESAGGLVSYDVDELGKFACFVLSGRLFVLDLQTGQTQELAVADSVIDPRFAPTGDQIAYATADGEVRLVSLAGVDRVLAAPETATQVWGRAEFIAAEEMDRFAGFWWAPDGKSLLAQRYDDAEVPTWFIADPANPATPANPQRYPAAGTTNSDVTLWHLDLAGDRTEIRWDRSSFEYLARVKWSAEADPIIQVLSRDQKQSQVLRVDPASGQTEVVRELADEAWVELSAAPQMFDGQLITLEDVAGWRQVCVDGRPLSGPQQQVRSIVAVDSAGVLVTASTEPTEVQLVRYGFDGSVEQLTSGRAVHSAVAGHGCLVVNRNELASTDTTITVVTAEKSQEIRSLAEPAPFTPASERIS